MNLADLKSLIQLTGTTLRITGGQLTSPKAHKLFKDFLQNETLVIQDATRTESEDNVAVEGILTEEFFNILHPKARAIFTLVEGEVRVKIKLSQFPQDWKLSDSFPSLASSLADSYFYEQPKFVLDSENGYPLPEDFQVDFGMPPSPVQQDTLLKRGLTFGSKIQYTGERNEISWLLQEENMVLMGPIEILNDQPRMLLQADIKSQSLASFTLPFKLQFVSLLQSLDGSLNDVFSNSFARVQCNIEHDTGQSAITIPVGATIYGKDPTIMGIKSYLDQEHTLGFAELSSLLEGNSIDHVQSDGFPVFDSISLYQMGFMVFLPTKRVSSLSVGFKFNKEWSIFSDLIKFHDLKVNLTLDRTSSTPTVRAEVMAQADISNKTIEGYISLPEQQFSCHLQEGNTINISGMIEDLLPDGIELPNLTCSAFQITGDVKNKRYGLSATMEEDWSIHMGSTNLTLKNTQLNLNKVFGDQPALDAQISGNFELGGVDIFAMAQHTSGDAGWRLVGRTSGSKRISLTAVAADILRWIGLELPSQIPDIQLLNLELDYDTGSKSLQVIGETAIPGKIPLGLKTHDLHTRVDLTSAIDPETGKRTFSGSMEADLELNGAQIRLRYSMGTGQHMLNGSWASVDGHTLGFEDFSGMLGISTGLSIPDGLNLELVEVGFQYCVEKEEFLLSAKSKEYGDAFIVARSDEDDGWGFVFGLNFKPDTAIKGLPGIGDTFDAVNEVIHVKQAAIIFSTANFEKFNLPILPRLDINSVNTSPNSTVPNQTKSFAKPIVANSELKLSQGMSLAAVIDFASSTGTVTKNMHSILGQDELVLQITLGDDISIFAQLQGQVGIPTAKNSSLSLADPTVKIDIVETGVTFQMSGEVKFNLNEEVFDAVARMILSDTEAQVAIDLKTENASLPSPLGLKGLHLEDIGIEMGVFFEPPGVDLGLEGKFRIGERTGGPDDKFAFVLEIIEEVPNPLLLSFYVAEIDFAETLTVFTDIDPSHFPSLFTAIKATEVSFYWADSLVVLPDGTVAQPGFGFNGNVDIFGFKAHAGLLMSITQGIHGLAEMSPIHLGGVLDVTGDGKGITENFKKVENDWVKLDNRQITRLPAGTETKQEVVVPPGGPQFLITTSGSPYLDVNWKITLFGLLSEEVTAVITNEGFTFKLEYKLSHIASASLQCSLKDRDSFSASARFNLDLDAHIGPIEILGIDFGTIHLDTQLNAYMGVVLNPSEFSMTISGSFEFEGLTLHMPTLELKTAPSSLTHLPALILQHIEDEAEEIFKDVFDLGKRLLKAAEKEAEEIGKAVAEEAVAVEHAAEEEAKKIAAAAKEAAHKVEEAAEAVAAEAKAVEKEAEEVAKAALAEAEEIGKAAFEEAGKIEKEAEKVVGDAVKEVAKIATAVAHEVAEIGKEVAKVFDAAEKEAAAIASAIAHEAEKIIGDAKAVAKAVLDEANKVASAIGHEATKLFSEAKDLANKAAHAISHAAKKVWHAISHY